MLNWKLFLELACPDENGKSRKVYKTEFIGKYSQLYFTNGCNWMRSLKNHYKYITDGRGDSWFIKLIGFDNENISRGILSNIWEKIRKERCVHTGFKDTSQNRIEVDHKNGRYDNKRVLILKTQKFSDFQPLCRQANMQKREYCKKCKNTNLRFDAKILGYNVSFINGDKFYNDDVGCNGCYWYDCLKFKKSLGSIVFNGSTAGS